ncbi:MAG: hypothetical protein A2X86_11115 [Bdellovibrionales bacterium GWA2_49_15]|nr:MAG: hypothetical protein A2X86_11115 [Bdellovibrionales bacterium GWA2_49_15]HAZ12700.1 hypothetical protein [Bdellovibrionales bacterium]
MENMNLLTSLDWQAISKDLGRRAFFEVNQLELEGPPIFLSHGEIEGKLCQLDELFSHLHLHSESAEHLQEILSSIPNRKEDSNTVQRLLKGHLLEMSEINKCVLYFEACFLLLAEFSKLNFSTAARSILPRKGGIEQKLISSWRTFVQKDGTIHYHRHAILGALDRELSALEGKLRNLVQTFSRQEPYESAMQFQSYDVVNDRFVLPIRADAYRSAMGPILARSSSGHTLFVEPFAMKEEANKRMRLLAQIEEEMAKIAREFQAKVALYQSEFLLAFEFLLSLDSLQARASYIQEKGLSRPILSDKFEIRLKGLFHPLITDPVQNDVHLTPDCLGMVISGPNTGGKTVMLKAISLTLLFLHKGLYIPAREGVLYPAQKIFFIGYDHQNLVAGLSSFSSEVHQYLEILANLQDHSILAIDEIFNSTGSEEASALAFALFEEMQSRASVKILVSTHHQLLKTLIHEDRRFLSAHMAFDVENNSPTYKLITGTPGPSFAFNIFEKVAAMSNCKTAIPDNAKSLMQTSKRLYETLLENVSRKEHQLDTQLAEVTSLRHDLHNQKMASQGVLRLEKERAYQDYEKDLKKILNEAISLKEEQNANPDWGIKAIRRKAQEITTDLTLLLPRPEKVPAPKEVGDYASVSAIETGKTYFSKLLGREVLVLQINQRKSEAQVSANKSRSGPRINHPLDQLFSTKDPVVKQREVKIQFSREELSNVEVNARGLRLPDFEVLLENGLTALLLDEIPYLSVIHGHGEGILKKYLRDRMKKDERFVYEIPDGNDGSTIIRKA